MNSAWIAKQLVCTVFKRKGLLICPETYWTGAEADLLIVTNDLRLIDVEIKVSRADFKRDAAKDKWWRHLGYDEAREQCIDTKTWNPWKHRQHRDWPPKVWKHYFAMPERIWTDELIEFLPSLNSGVILLRENPSPYWFVKRKATPNRDAKKIDGPAVIDIARLAHFRMWDALVKLEEAMAA